MNGAQHIGQYTVLLHSTIVYIQVHSIITQYYSVYTSTRYYYIVLQCIQVHTIITEYYSIYTSTLLLQCTIIYNQVHNIISEYYSIHTSTQYYYIILQYIYTSTHYYYRVLQHIYKYTVSLQSTIVYIEGSSIQLITF